MPRYAPDLDLLAVARQYVENVHDAVVKRAAEELQIDYVMFRRFLTGGSAKPENRQQIRNALQRKGFEIIKNHKIAYEIPVDMTRSMLTQLLQALDVYQNSAAAAQEEAP